MHKFPPVCQQLMSSFTAFYRSLNNNLIKTQLCSLENELCKNVKWTFFWDFIKIKSFLQIFKQANCVSSLEKLQKNYNRNHLFVQNFNKFCYSCWLLFHLQILMDFQIQIKMQKIKSKEWNSNKSKAKECFLSWTISTLRTLKNNTI